MPAAASAAAASEGPNPSDLVGAASPPTPALPLQVEILDDSCGAQLTALWQAYEAPPVAPVAGCDEACIQACGATLKWGLYSEKVQDCPMQEDMIRCFHVSWTAGWVLEGRAGDTCG